MPTQESPSLIHAADDVFSLLDRELWVVTTQDGALRGGLVATFVSKASIVPESPRMAVGLAKQHHTCGLIAKTGRFATHLLWPDQLDLVWRFALASGRDLDKFAGLEVRESPLGNPVIPQALAWLDCRVETRLDTGDRLLFLAEVCAGETRGKSIPLTVNRLYYEAPEDKRRELAGLYQHDCRVDADAIQAWRELRAEETS